jgi:hypothetical protein
MSRAARRPPVRARRTRPVYVSHADLNPKDVLRQDRHTRRLDLGDVFGIAMVHPHSTRKALQEWRCGAYASSVGISYVRWVHKTQKRRLHARPVATPIAALAALRTVSPPRTQHRHGFDRIVRFLDTLVRNDNPELLGAADDNSLESDGGEQEEAGGVEEAVAPAAAETEEAEEAAEAEGPE